ncbi:RDD family protein [Pseudobdellovibrio sp. HCB154]|uniref:RDD family protein n=1 Tax=Pseudobdellovibrio sp. HCB154 TaxID=3386277 RepID=UPI0039172319
MVYSGFWRRFVASFLDGLIMLIPAWILGMLLPYVGGIILGLVYKPVFEASALKGTPGKAMMGMVVLSESGDRLTLKQAYIRYFCSILSGLVLCIGYLMNLFTAKRQTLHDMIAESVVINQEPPDLNYFQVWKSEMKVLFNRLSGDATTVSNAAGSVSSSSISAQSADVSKAIEDLHRLYQSGALSQAEYDAKKQELLSKI